MDTSAIFVSVLGISAPSFFMGIVIAYLFGFVLSSWTGLHMTGNLFDTDPFSGRHMELQNLILPAVTLGIRPLAIIARADARGAAGRTGPGLYPDGLCERAVSAKGGLETRAA
ncbi:hypothetical protein ACQ86N_19985 [Puia sp. P3]|uniref:hypothetical protein n=1 Tax=Puia sp. P3 TaxID=3423952 RepID=UPI003D665200